MDYVIIGNSAAAVGAVEGIRQVDREGRITVISDEPYHTYSRPLISYWLAGKVAEDKMMFRKENFYEINNVNSMLGSRVRRIDFEDRKVELEDGTVVPYKRLLVAAGGKPVIPPVDGLDKEGVFTFIKLNDVKEIKHAAAAGKKKAVVIGAGLIGLKAAEALNRLGIDVTVVELANRILPAILDEESAQMVQGYLEGTGIKFILNNSVSKVIGDAEVTGVTLRDETVVKCDMLVVAIGVRPNTGLVEGRVSVNRGILVNEKMETSLDGVYAAGDVSEGFDISSGANRVLPLLPNAYLQGEAAGRNMAGVETIFNGGLAMNAIGFGDLPMLTAGIVKPDSEEFEILVNADPETCSYRKIILKDNKIVGYILLNKVDRAGILTGLIKEKTDITPFKERLMSPGFGYVDFPEADRKARLSGGAVQ
ncbi:NAD(P)/FAD-dependent oxidoreductase [Phosphitispora fastidiosa]|uniref:NAD(P)/FAD-dependent oxidoreductase n=1 Tax=Phosphitispora fastidiosa TaxID=2837202 RepID=UPI001E5EA468|nr:FAD-dependent oxidoreductase [Phosphitispora fastidiosa]MBU7008416.1 NAD(P)H-nitrite reductase large subunit [Phosphitispora fastidiosa]